MRRMRLVSFFICHDCGGRRLLIVMVDMRKSMARDKDHQHVRENGENFHVDPSSVYF